MPKASKDHPPHKEDPPFEEALAQLESLVREMESDQMPLEALIQNYEEGTRLFRACEKRLDEAEGRIEIIRKKRNGGAVLDPLDGSGENQTSTDPETDESEEHGELF